MESRRGAALAALALGTGTALTGVGLLLATPASAGQTVAGVTARAPADAGDPTPTGGTVLTPVPTQPVVSQQPTSAPASSAPTPKSSTSKARSTATAAATARGTATATSTRLTTAAPTARSSYVYRTYAPTTGYTGTGSGTSSGTSSGSGTTYYGGSVSDVPVGVAATGTAVTTATISPGSSADPVYAAAATGTTTTTRRYIDVQGISVNKVLALVAIAGALVGLFGGAGLWLTRGAR